MKSRPTRARVWWHARQPREQKAMKILLAALALIALGSAWTWLRAERLRLQSAVPLAEARLQRMQDDVAEVDRLRAQPVAARAPEQALLDTVQASARSRKLDLLAKSEGVDRVRVQGTTGFDNAVEWFAGVQRDNKLRLLSLTASRDGSSVKLDAVLVPAQPQP